MGQAGARGKASRMQYKKLQDQKLALFCVQRTIRNFWIAKTWLWLQLWLAIKPHLKCTQFGKYKKEYEDKIEEAEAHIDKATADCAAVTAKHEKLVEAKNELQLALASGGSAVQDIIDKTNRLEASKNDLQKQVDGVNLRVKNKQDTIASIEQSATKVVADASRLREEIKVLESSAEACEEDKVTKDNQIRTIREEISRQEELIVKLQRDKKDAGGGRQKIEEDMQAMEDRCVHLGKVKVKLEMSLDECEDVLERERKGKGDVEKIKRKLEGDLKLTQETVSDLERSKTELQAVLQRKEKEFSSIGAKIDDEHTLAGKYGKQIKELQSRIDELDDELSIERQCRAKAEKSRTTLSRALADLNARMEDTGLNTSTQIELNKKKLDQLNELKQELDESNIAFEGTLAALRSKHNSTIAELGEQIDNLNKNKSKSENDKAGMERDLQDTRHALEEVMRDRANIEKNCKMTQATIAESNAKFDELARALNDADSHKKKLLVEQQDLVRQIEETENAISQLGKNKISLSTQLADTKTLADAEARDRATLLSKFKGLGTDCENLKMRIDEEAEKKNDILRLFSKAQSEIQLWKSKYETEALAKIDELEGSRSKLNNRVAEAEETVESLNTKISATEKSKHRLESELEDIALEYERTHAAAVITEKRARNFDKIVGEWKCKADDLMSELEAFNTEFRNYSSEVYRLRTSYEESTEALDIVKRGNKNLGDEIKDLLDQLGDGGRSIHDLDKQRRRLEVEKEELQSALEEAEGALESEENRVLRAQLELGQVKQDIDRKITEKEEEFDNTRKNHARAMDSMQASLECEQRAKAEALRMKRKLEGDINDLEISVDQANKANNEAQKSIKRYQTQLREAECG